MCEHDFDFTDEDVLEYDDDIDFFEEEEYEAGIDPVAEAYNEEF